MPTQHDYVYNQNTFGLQYTMAQTWTIATGVFVGSHDTTAVLSTYDGSKLINKGHVYSAQGNGVRFTGSDSSVINRRPAASSAPTASTWKATATPRSPTTAPYSATRGTACWSATHRISLSITTARSTASMKASTSIRAPQVMPER